MPARVVPHLILWGATCGQHDRVRSECSHVSCWLVPTVAMLMMQQLELHAACQTLQPWHWPCMHAGLGVDSSLSSLLDAMACDVLP